jgi:hypothetical protein
VRAAVVEAEAAEDEARSEAQRTLRALKRAEAVAADTAERSAAWIGAEPAQSVGIRGAGAASH